MASTKKRRTSFLEYEDSKRHKHIASTDDHSVAGINDSQCSGPVEPPAKEGKLLNFMNALDEFLREDELDKTQITIGEFPIHQALALQHTLRKLTQQKQTIKSDGASLLVPGKSNDRNLGKSISTLQLTPWTSSSIPSRLPPLPPVLDPTLEIAAFTHSGFGSGRITDLSYERLEWVGDAYLYITSTLLISQTFPALLPGKCAQLRERLVKNLTLAEYARNYGFEKRARLPESILPGGKFPAKDSEMTKIMGDIFEAYVAAVVLSDPANGVARVSEWLKGIWAMTLAKQITNEEKNGMQIDSPLWRLRGAVDTSRKLPEDTTAAPLNAKNQLQQLLGSKGVKLVYKDAAPEKKDRDSKLPIFTVGIYLTGWGENDKQIAFGSANGKKEAGMKAAEKALANKKMMSGYLEKKKKFDAQLEREKAAMRAQVDHD